MNKFLEEIQGQPEALKQTFSYYCSGKGQQGLNTVCALWKSGEYERFIFTGMGSSYFISQAAATMLSSVAIPAFAINAGELLHSQSPVLSKRTLLVAISQSGESYEVIELLKRQGQLPITVIGITNEPESSLAVMATYCLLCKAGKEEMTSTKTFVTTYLIAYLLAQTLKSCEVNEGVLDEIIREVELMLVEKNSYLSRALTFLDGHSFVQVIGRGTIFAAVAQTALMFMEATKTPASALLGGEFRHGPLEMVDSDFICIIYAHSQSGVFAPSIRLVKDVLSFKGKVILISDVATGIESPNLLEVNIRCEHSDLFAILAVVPVQLMVNAWAEEMNLVPGGFTHGAKVTAIE